MKQLPTGVVVLETSDWGASPPRYSPFPSTTPADAVVHHMDWPNRDLIPDHQAAVQKAIDVARTCQQDHMKNNGWADTGQHFTVTRDGVILEGRHGSLAALFAGHCIRAAHAYDGSVTPVADDNDSWGVEHEGMYVTAEMPQPQWDASVNLYASLCFLSKLDSETIKGHRDTRCVTACPGDWLEAQLPRFRQAVHDLIANLRQH